MELFTQLIIFLAIIICYCIASFLSLLQSKIKIQIETI